MIILDTCALIFDALTPDRLSTKASRAIEEGQKYAVLACCDISLWEIAMLVKKDRLDPGTDALSFIRFVLCAREIRVLSITPEIAQISVTHPAIPHSDPADRLIAATTLHYEGRLVTSDKRLRNVEELQTIW